MNFGSDNQSGVHPDILAAILAANDGAAAAYGRDPLTRAALDAVRAAFEAPEAAVFLLGTGTGANALTLAQIAPPWGRIFCHRDAHVARSEAGAPAAAAGGALVTPIGAGAVLTRDDVTAALAEYPQDDEHDGLNAVLSVTNATEWGRVLDPAAVAALAAPARAAGLRVHCDGARLANAVAATGAAPADLTWRAGVDALALGGTKNGCLALEAAIFFDPARADGFRFRRMQAGQLWSKHRFLAAQMLAWLDGDRWLRLAAHANAMAAALAAGLPTVQPVEANAVFLRLPRAETARLRAAGLRAADWPAPGDDAAAGTIRLVTSWATTDADIAAFRRAVG